MIVRKNTNTLSKFDTSGPTIKVTNSTAHIHKSIEETTDLLVSCFHRPAESTADTPLEESISARDELRRAGTTKFIGLSECSVANLRKAHAIAKIDAMQAEYSAFETLHETDGLIDTARELGVAYVAYSPLGHGWLVNDFKYKPPDDFATDDFCRTCKTPKFQGDKVYKNKAIVYEIRKLALRKGCSVAQVALAWVTAQSMINIPGTTRAGCLEENWRSRDVRLTDAERAEMRRIVDDAKPVGKRYAEYREAMVGH
ncbi:aldo/keto reductase [Cordyceps fumosorosea ARSEF 2679]|uniref:Aldo/keto reductase n=1 Tax=Cordyceps fumosorosea (strain ARSEF 2679) TaxID=1081104 RepID=A0A167FJG0_CORFA|nr:aldo/keto reductase [Cordyceps fumosorosea ARSEF 2679]OAA45357.1 aldo/keto reductase [Cordyceps fumosorosea ARSEF 2679]